jgi:hypothetical protein
VIKPIYYLDGQIRIHPLCGDQSDSRLELESGYLQWRANTGRIVWSCLAPTEGMLFRAWVQGCEYMGIPYSPLTQDDLDYAKLLFQSEFLRIGLPFELLEKTSLDASFEVTY